MTIEDSYVHDLTQNATAHPDGIQCDCSNVTIRHNTIYGTSEVDGLVGNAALIFGRGGESNILIENNLLAPGDICPFGGDAIQVGYDVNLNDELETAEIESTAYQCLSSPNICVGDVQIETDAEAESWSMLKCGIVDGTISISGKRCCRKSRV